MSAALLLAIELALRAQPSQLVLGERDRVELRLDIEGELDGATPAIWASVGSVDRPRRVAANRFTAVWRPPRERYPQVALFLATMGSGRAEGRAWLSLPLVSREPLSLSTKPNSQVELDVDGRIFGPVHTDGEGRARIPARVPPGVGKATVRVRDPFGNVNESVIDLSPPPSRRLHVVALSAAAPPDEAGPAALEIFAVTPAGRPAAAGDLLLSTDRGRLGPLRAVGRGVFRVELRATASAAEAAKVRVRLAGEGGDETVVVALRARPAAEAPPAVEAQPAAAAREPVLAAVEPLAERAPDPSPADLEAGFLFGGRTNFSHAQAMGSAVEVAGQTGLASLEVLARAGLWRFSSSRALLAAPGVFQSADLSGLSLVVGARRALGTQGVVALHGSLSAGALRSFGSLRIVGGPADGAREGVAAWGSLFAAALGASMPAGAGRAVAEVQFAVAPARGDVAGNLGGLGLSFGYLFGVR